MNERPDSRAFSLPGAVLLLLFMASPGLGASNGDAAKGKAIFDSHCSVCHTIGGGIKLGPDLKGISGLRSGAWLKNFISNPDHVIKSGDPAANRLLKEFHGLEMPTLGLSPEQVGDVIAYFQSTASPSWGQVALPPKPAPVSPAPAPGAKAASPVKSAQPVPSAAPPAAVFFSGSPEAGRQLFTGLTPFQKGGPACVSCHDAAILSFPGGGTLGPDLTGAFTKFGVAGLKSALGTLSFPTMKPVFDGRPLTLQEQDDLVAFLQNAGAQSLISRTMEVGLSALGGLLVLVLAVWLLWQDRIGTVRRSLVERAERSGGAKR
jgi:mono/diheme cytochrome c family protein